MELTTRFDREFRLLALLSARHPAASPFFGEFAQGAGLIEWPAFRSLISRHRVGALVVSGLEQIPVITLPDSLRDALARLTQRNARDFMTGLDAAQRTTSALRAAGIDSVVLKGISVAAGFYDQPAKREMIDVDMMVPRQHLPKALEIALEQGFSRIDPDLALSGQGMDSYLDLHCAYTLRRQRDNYQLDMHWRCMKNPALLPWLDLGWQGMTEQVAISGLEIPVLRPGAHFVYVMVHGAKHGWVRLKWLADIDRMLPQLKPHDLAEAVALIETGGLGRLMASTCMLVRDIFGTEIPAEASELVQRYDGRKLHHLGIALLNHELPGKNRGLRNWAHYRDRARNSLGLVSVKGYRRRALLQEAARPADLARVSVKPSNLWMMGIISPILAVGRAARRTFGRSDLR